MSDPRRTNRLDFLGEVNLPRKREVKSKPLLPIPLRDARAYRQQIDLSACYNAALNETWQPVVGFDQADLNLAGLPRGLRDFGDVTFDVRGLIQLCRSAADWQWEWQTYPDQVRIPVGRSFNRLHALHGAAYSDRDGTRIGAYRLRYGDGSEHALDIVYAHDLADWVGPAGAPLGQANDPVVLAWRGENPALPPGEASRSLRLFRRTYQNPRPELEVVSIDFVSAVSQSAPFLVALTVE